MTNITLLLLLITFAATVSTFNAQEKKCEHVIVVNTGATGGPSYKLYIYIEAVGGGNINTTNFVKNWGDMGKGHTYFKPNSSDRFKYNGPCMRYSFCAIGLRGKKGVLNPPWYVHNITVTTSGQGDIRFKTFNFNSGNEISSTYPEMSDGECGDVS